MVIPFKTIGYNGPTLEVETLERELQVKSAQAEEAKWIVPLDVPLWRYNISAGTIYIYIIYIYIIHNIHSKKNQG